MTDFAETGRGVTFDELRPSMYLDIAKYGRVMADNPTTEGLHQAVERTLEHPDFENGIDNFMAAELRVGDMPLPWEKDWMHQEDVDQVQGWITGFTDKLGFLAEIEDYIGLGSREAVAQERLGWFVSNAAAVYLEMVDLTAKVNKWPHVDRLAANAKVIAELAMPDKRPSWQFWNGVATDYTNGKVSQLRGKLRLQPA
jgi:hypothetical protein